MMWRIPYFVCTATVQKNAETVVSTYSIAVETKVTLSGFESLESQLNAENRKISESFRRRAGVRALI